MIGRGLEGRNSVPGRCTIQLKCDGTRWRKGGEVKVKLASTLHTTSEHGVSSITTSDAHTSAASSRLNWRPCRFKWTRPFRRKTKSGFCACATASQTHITYLVLFHCVQTDYAAQPVFYSMFMGWGLFFLSLKVRWLVCEGNHCTLPRAKGKDA